MNVVHTLDDIEQAVAALATSLVVKPYYLPTFGHSEDSARPHIELAREGMSYVVVERGKELKRLTTSELDTLLYWIFRDVTFSLGVDHEVANRVDGQDFRIVLFQHQLQLLERLQPKWRTRYAREKADRLSELGIPSNFGAR